MRMFVSYMGQRLLLILLYVTLSVFIGRLQDYIFPADVSAGVWRWRIFSPVASSSSKHNNDFNTWGQYPSSSQQKHQRQMVM